MFRIVVLFLSIVPLSAQIVVDTYAGGKIRTGVPAQDVQIRVENGIAWDASGNLVFCDGRDNVIRRVRRDGIIETIAGTGVTGYSGDGGPALRAALNLPSSTRYDAAGNLYFADNLNYRIRRIDASGTITTVAGDGIRFVAGMDTEGPAALRSLDWIGDLAVDRFGNVYFSEPYLNRVRRVTPDGKVAGLAGVSDSCPNCSDGDGGPASAAHLNAPTLLAIDGSGNVFVEEGNSPPRIRRISPDGAITTYVDASKISDERNASPIAPNDRIVGMTANASGNLYIAQSSSFSTRLRRIEPNGAITTIAGGGRSGSPSSPDGPALPSSVTPSSLAANDRGDIAFVDYFFLIRVVTSQSTLMTVAGASPEPAPAGIAAREAWLDPSSIAFNRAGELFIADSAACLIRKIGTDGILRTVAGTGKCAAATPSSPNPITDLPRPYNIVVDSQGRVRFNDSLGHLFMIAQDGTVTNPSFPVGINVLSTLAIDSKDRVYVLNPSYLVRFPPGGEMEVVVSRPANPGVPPADSGPRSLTAIGVDPAGNVYFAGDDSIFRVNDNGTFTRLFEKIASPYSLAVDRAGNVWQAEGWLTVTNSSGKRRIGRIESGFSGDGGLAQSARFSAVLVAFAPDGDLYIADGSRIRKLTGLAPPPIPVIASGGIVSAATYTGGAIAPGELISIFGSNFGVSGLQTNSADNNSIPRSLGRTKVLFNGEEGAITAATPTQINVFVPNTVTPGSSVEVVVQVDAVVSAPVTAPVAKSAFGLFASNGSGSGQAAVLNQDGLINSSANPAAPGSIVSFFGTGEGFTSPELPGGALVISTPYPVPVDSVTVSIGGQEAEILYAGAAPFLAAGILQINARVPAGVNSGEVSVSAAVGGGAISQSVTLAVRARP